MSTAHSWIGAGAPWVAVRRDDEIETLGEIEGTSDEHTVELPVADGSILVGGPIGAGLDARIRCEADLLDQLARRRTESSALTRALIEANDQVLGLSALAHLAAGSLESGDVVASVLAEALSVVDADGFRLEHADGTELCVGAQAETSSLTMTVPVNGRVHCGAFLTMIRNRGQGIESSTRRSGFGMEFDAPLSTGDRKLLSTVAATVAGRLDLMASHERAIDQALKHQEYESASAVALAVLPNEVPEVPGTSIRELCVPALASGGDFFCHGTPSRGLYLAAGDASGKGLPASLLAATAVTAATGAFARHPFGDPTAVIRDLTTDLHRYLIETSRLVTLAVLFYRPGDSIVRVANAGHSPVLHRNRGIWRLLRPTAPPLGVSATCSVRDQALPVEVGDLVVLGSDGLIDQENNAGEVLGYHGLLDLLEPHAESSVAEVDAAIWHAVTAHGADVAQTDDQTVVGLEITGDGR